MAGFAGCPGGEDETELERLCDERFPLLWDEEEDMDDELSGPAEAREKSDFLIGSPAEVAPELQ